MEFSRQEYWSGLPCPPPRDLPDPGIKPGSPALQADSLPSETPGMICTKNSADMDSTVWWWTWLLQYAALCNRSPLTSTPVSAQPRLWNWPQCELGLNIPLLGSLPSLGSAALLWTHCPIHDSRFTCDLSLPRIRDSSYSPTFLHSRSSGSWTLLCFLRLSREQSCALKPSSPRHTPIPAVEPAVCQDFSRPYAYVYLGILMTDGDGQGCPCTHFHSLPEGKV